MDGEDLAEAATGASDMQATDGSVVAAAGTPARADAAGQTPSSKATLSEGRSP